MLTIEAVTKDKRSASGSLASALFAVTGKERDNYQTN
jgi:hypothetical protein